MSVRPRRRIPLVITATGAALALGAGLLGAAGATGAGAPEDQRVQRYDDARTSVVVVSAPTRALRNRVVSLGLDHTEHATAEGVEVVLHGAADAERLRKAGFTWRTKVADLGARMQAAREADRAYAARVDRSALPSGRTSYRTYPDYLRDLDRLAARYPRLTKPLTLSHRTVLGRPIRGIEITADADRVADGKPVFLLMGAHHAREWPSSEHVLEFAFDLLQSYRAGDARARRVLTHERVIVVPIVNVDGFIISRNADPLGDYSLFDYEMKRKNCTVSAFTPAEYRGGTCVDNPAGRLRGVDLNRNYPGFWGGDGASPEWSSDTYRGDGPSSEPEVQAIRDLVSSRAVTVLITNHTYSNLVLRAPGVAATGLAPDEPAYKALGDAMAGANGYTSQLSYQLYDTSGTTEDWSYWNTGGYGFTFEIGPDDFHPEYADAVVAEYAGLPPAAGAGQGGNREAYYLAAEAAADPVGHSLIRGRAPAGATITLRKRFVSQTANVIDSAGNPGPSRPYEDVVTTRYRTRGGSFTLHANPSTRPIVVGRYGRDPVAPPQAATSIANPAGVPAVDDSETTTVEIQGPPEADNGTALLSFAWPDGADWDFYVYDATGAPVSSAATLDNPEVVRIPDPVPGTYTVEAVNYEGGSAADDWTGEATFQGPTPPAYSGLTEAWSLVCRGANGRVLGQRPVTVARGATAWVGAACTGGRQTRLR